MTQIKQIKSKSKSKTNVSSPLIIEQHPSNYTGLPVISLVQYRKQPMLVLIDNIDKDAIRVYHLDLCNPLHIDETVIITAALQWFENNKDRYPLSVEFNLQGISDITSQIYRVLNTEFVSRIIGPAPTFPMNIVKSSKKRRRKAVTPQIPVLYEGNVIPLCEFSNRCS